MPTTLSQKTHGSAAGQLLHEVEDGVLLRFRKPLGSSHRQAGTDAGERVVGAEERREGSHADAGGPGAGATELIGQQEDGDRDQAEQGKLVMW